MTSRDAWVDWLAVVIAWERWGKGNPDMGGKHNPRPNEKRAARHFLEDLERDGWRRVVADEETVERVASAITKAASDKVCVSPEELKLARAAINAMGGT